MNVPVNEAGYVTCIVRGELVKTQTYITDSSDVYVRTCNSGNWGNWSQLALKSEFTYTSKTATAGQNVTINTQDYGVMGSICSGQINFTLSAEVTYYANLINTGCAPRTAMKFPLYDNNGNMVASKGLYMDRNNVFLRASAPIPAGTYHASFMFFYVP